MPSLTAKTRVILCGEKQIAEHCLEFLYQREDTEIAAIVATPNDWQADLISWGLKRRIKVYVGNINLYADELSRLQPDLIFSLQYRLLLRPEILQIPPRGCINLHFGLLPRYGGCYPIAWAILNGEPQAGATLHYMSDRFDEGDIIARCAVPIAADTTARELFDTISDRATALFKHMYPALCNGDIVAEAQDLAKQLYYTKDSIDFERDRCINWLQPAIAVQRQICAFTFQPFQQALTIIHLPNGQTLPATVTQTRPVSGHEWDPTVSPGQIMAVTPSGAVVVAAGESTWLEISVLNDQPARAVIESMGYRPHEVYLKSAENRKVAG